MPAEEHPVGTFPPTEATPSPEVGKMGLSELQELIKWPSKMEEFATEQAAPEPPLDLPEPPETVVESPAPEPTPAAAAPAAEPEKPAELSQEDIDRELLKAQVEAMEAHSKRLEAKLTGREAGERGYIKQLQERIKRLESGNTDGEAEPSYRPEPPADIVSPQPDGFRTWAVQKAAEEALTKFQSSHSDLGDMENEATKFLNDTGFDARTIFQLDDPIAAGREMTRVLEEAYWHVKEQRTRARVTELQTRKADQVRGLDEAKRRAAPSASGSPPPPVPPPKTTRDLSLPELEARMKALTRR